MLRLVADEDFNNDILRGLKRREPTLDIVRVQDVGLRMADDETHLTWAAQEGRVILSHDHATLIAAAYRRVELGLPMSGVIEVSKDMAVGHAIDDILLLAVGSYEGELDGRVLFVPLNF